jgi:hypothetical protein
LPSDFLSVDSNGGFRVKDQVWLRASRSSREKLERNHNLMVEMVLVLVPNNTVKFERIRRHLLNAGIESESIHDISTEGEITEPLGRCSCLAVLEL